ncbi:MAG TPA: WD40 repeat domain-containing protein, partial [Bryobacteraceae bacterium]|nr:WD40 repeat domain-containing protein [Bryobacteraceae bacterium]
MTRLSTSGFVLITFVTGAIAQAPKPAKHLQSRPRPPLAQLRFSPDGRYILAQDASGVTVLTVQPFAVYFRIPAGDADPAQFTPDSQQIVFVSSATSVRLASPGNSGHLERWNIADHSRVAFTEIRLHGCDTKELSPDGLVLACVDSRGTLRLLDIASGGTIFQKEHLAKEFVVDHPGDP